MRVKRRGLVDLVMIVAHEAEHGDLLRTVRWVLRVMGMAREALVELVRIELTKTELRSADKEIG